MSRDWNHKSDNIADQIETVESNHYLFEPPSDEPDPELLKLLPKKNLIEQIVDIGLYFVAAFQVFQILEVSRRFAWANMGF